VRSKNTRPQAELCVAKTPDHKRNCEKQIPSLFGDCKIYKLTIFKDEDEDFKNDWVDYHNKNCNFQILCRDCNLRKKKT